MLIATSLANAGGALTLTELSQRTGMYKSTLLRLLSSLQKAGLVVHRNDKRYALGPLAFVFGRSFEQTNGLQEAIYPQLAWLVNQGTESGSFHVRHDDESRLCLMRIDSNHSTLDRIRPGDLLPIRRGAAGKVLTTFGEGPRPSSSIPRDCCSPRLANAIRCAARLRRRCSVPRLRSWARCRYPGRWSVFPNWRCRA
ncbi:helix-turn-helix domain-containing protein [Diaphorobacter aerolatus]|uniref:helix-turn-helix domain-containing protein n=1 Tax=Diaphorobacter aerolatus TaxID=1288495 RepID=UPI001D0275FD|nr:helix-turn-helix domain-containing protein [Diaphorobacter aerolatus]